MRFSTVMPALSQAMTDRRVDKGAHAPCPPSSAVLAMVGTLPPSRV